MSYVPFVLSISCQSSEGGSVVLSWRHLSCWSLNSTLFLGLISQYADMLSATIFRNPENETRSHRMIQPSNSLVPWTQGSQMLISDACRSLYRTLAAALLMTGRTWKPPRCPSGVEWKQTGLHPRDRTFFSAEKSWERRSHGETRGEPSVHFIHLKKPIWRRGKAQDTSYLGHS